MLIDGFTIVAQMVNFLVLVLLLKRFLYGPVIRAMKEREARIARAVERSKTAEQEARRRADDLAAQHQAFLDGKAEMLAGARKEIEQWREEKMEGLRAEVEDLRGSWIEKVDQDRQVFLRQLKADAVRHVMHMADKVIRDLADQEVEARIVSVFMDKMEKERKDFQARTYSGPLRLRSGFELGDRIKDSVREQFRQWFPASEPVDFETSVELGMGVELLAGDRKIAWNLEKYLNDLEREVLLVLPSSNRKAA